MKILVKFFMKPNLFIKNVSGQTKVVAMKLDLKSMPEGRVQCCIDNCMMFSNPAVEIFRININTSRKV